MEVGYSTHVRNGLAYKNKWPIPYLESFKKKWLQWTSNGTMKIIGIWMLEKKYLVFLVTFLIPFMTWLWSFWVVSPSLNHHTWLMWWMVETTSSNKLETYKTRSTSLMIHHLSKSTNRTWKFQHDRGCYDNGVANTDEAWMQYEEPLVTPLPFQFRSCIVPIAFM